MIPFYDALDSRFRDLHHEIRTALESLPPEALDWVPGPEMNSLSVIITHLTGAERYLIGDVIMGDPSNRNRDAEFQVKGLSKSDLLRRLDQTEAYLTGAFAKLTLEDLAATRLHPRRGEQVNVAWALLHALDHIALHTGHVEITVQLWQQHAG